MRRLLLALLLLAGPALAQAPPTPIVETVLDQSQTVPGQSVTLRLNILVPTWMPNPPELPTFESPNLRVRVPPRGSTAISRQVDGQNWSGISHRYLLTPMVPGQFVLPPQKIELTWADPGGPAPLTATVQTEPVTLTGTVPKGAEGLDPFIAAKSLVLTQDLSGPSTGLTPGASVIRTVTAKIEGTSPIVLPTLMPQFDLPAIRAYPASPQVTEDDGAEELSGTRVESETLMALGGGQGSAPPISLDWFNLGTGKVETASVPGFDISVAGPPPKSAQTAQQRDWRLILTTLALVLGVAAMLRGLWPRARDAAQTHRQARLASEAYARSQLLTAISRRDYPQTSRWLEDWRARLPAGVPMQDLSELFAAVGATLYAAQPASPASPWEALAHAVRATPSVWGRSNRQILPELNPGSQAR
ncbi:BatD family protein [Paracoccus sp. PAR01]|uniref:BatD family protein n=1 Tax=Paracoccus sp. PAR01 TaxID=2769282 RepID=UPI0017820852|nr:BatD family protein [Paracoccus sp. PAR01]MBD9527447.1 BatD family protein [Paracoccus sp. PAR01]